MTLRNPFYHEFIINCQIIFIYWTAFCTETDYSFTRYIFLYLNITYTNGICAQNIIADKNILFMFNFAIEPMKKPDSQNGIEEQTKIFLRNYHSRLLNTNMMRDKTSSTK
jgi:hypothetical protein